MDDDRTSDNDDDNDDDDNDDDDDSDDDFHLSHSACYIAFYNYVMLK